MQHVCDHYCICMHMLTNHANACLCMSCVIFSLARYKEFSWDAHVCVLSCHITFWYTYIYVLIDRVLSVVVWMHFLCVYICGVCGMSCMFWLLPFYVAIVICNISWIHPLVCHFHILEIWLCFNVLYLWIYHQLILIDFLHWLFMTS